MTACPRPYAGRRGLHRRAERLGAEADPALGPSGAHLRSSVRCVWTYLVAKILDHKGFSFEIYGPEPDKSKRIVGKARPLVSLSQIYIA